MSRVSWNLLLLSLVMPLILAVESLAWEDVIVNAGQSFNNEAFTYQQSPRPGGTGYSVRDIRFPTPQPGEFVPNNTVPAELYIPDGVDPQQPHPGVVCFHILNGNFDLERLLCARLARAGVVALYFKQPYYGERGGNVGKNMFISSVETFTKGLDQGVADARRALDIVASLPEVSPEKLGVTGISMGAIQAATLCGFEPRINQAYLILGGGNLRGIVASARETRQLRAHISKLSPADQQRVWRTIERHDPLQAAHELQQLATAGALRMVCAAEDEVIRPEFSLELAEAIGIKDQVIWLEGMGHYTALAGFSATAEDVAAFFSAGLPAIWIQPAENNALTPHQLVGKLLFEISMMLNGKPEMARAHVCSLEVDTTLGKERYKGRLTVIRGEQGKFAISGDFPTVGKAGIGYGRYPWMSGKGGRAFCGSLEAVHPVSTNITALISPARILNYRFAVGALSGAALAPEVFAKYYTLTEKREGRGRREVELKVAYKKNRGTLTALFNADNTPVRIDFESGESRGTVKIVSWRLNSDIDATVFDEPPGVERREVPQVDVERMLAAMFEFILEKFE